MLSGAEKSQFYKYYLCCSAAQTIHRLHKCKGVLMDTLVVNPNKLVVKDS